MYFGIANSKNWRTHTPEKLMQPSSLATLMNAISIGLCLTLLGFPNANSRIVLSGVSHLLIAGSLNAPSLDVLSRKGILAVPAHLKTPSGMDAIKLIAPVWKTNGSTSLSQCLLLMIFHLLGASGTANKTI
jgi:hypothetical protein